MMSELSNQNVKNIKIDIHNDSLGKFGELIINCIIVVLHVLYILIFLYHYSSNYMERCALKSTSYFR